MADYNRVMLIGRVGAVILSDETTRGELIARFALSTTDTWPHRKTGEPQNHVEWHRIVVQNTFLARIALDRLAPGVRVLVEGRLRTRHFSGPEGRSLALTEIVLGAFKSTLDIQDGAGGPVEAGEPELVGWYG